MKKQQSKQPYSLRSEPDVTLSIPADKFDQPMLDKRYMTMGQKFGTVRDAAKQFGIAVKKIGDNFYLNAPRRRMQSFLEKVHYSMTPYKIVKRSEQ